MPTAVLPEATSDAAAIGHALEMARRLPSDERIRLRVGVLSSRGMLISGGTLHGFDQAAVLRDQLRTLGYTEYVAGERTPGHGCDLLLKQQAGR